MGHTVISSLIVSPQHLRQGCKAKASRTHLQGFNGISATPRLRFSCGA